MKISKIDHTRSTYTVLDDAHRRENAYSEKTGVIYKTPSADSYAVKNLEEHIALCNQKAMQLYSVINSRIRFCGEDNPDYPQYATLIRYFNTAILRMLEYPSVLDPEERVKEELAFLRNIRSQKITFDDGTVLGGAFLMTFGLTKEKDKITRLVYKNLRRSLNRPVRLADGSKINFADCVVSVMNAICNTGKMEEVPAAWLEAFCTSVDQDYSKTKQLQLIKKSIEAQTVKISVTEKDGKYRLIPSNADHPKKKYAFDFLCRYCAASQEEKKSLIMHIQHLILLYFFGEEGYQAEGSLYDYALKSGAYLSEELGGILSEIESQQKIYQDTKEEADQIKQAFEEKKVSASEFEQKKSRKKELIQKKNKAREMIAGQEKLRQPATISAMSVNYRRAVKYLTTQVPESILGTNTTTKVCSSGDLYWIDYIDGVVKKLLLDGKNETKSYRFQIRYLCIHVWKEWTQYIASKYIDLGKAAYHFAPPDLSEVAEGKEVSIGEVLPEFVNGISGFEYERIKAEESLEREMAEYISFAIHNFANAVSDEEEREKKGHEDVLVMITEEEAQKPENRWRKNRQITLYGDQDADVCRRILAFFGGKSHFEKKESDITLYSGKDLYCGLRDELYNLRNLTFHYTAEEKEAGIDHDVAMTFFQDDMETVGSIFRKKFYSNNVPQYYGLVTINDLMTRIYRRRAARAAQVPAFNRIISRPAIATQIGQVFIKKTFLEKIRKNSNREMIENYWSSLFFILKELYYYDFLQNEEKLKAAFFTALENQKTKTGEINNPEALENFTQRIDEIGRDKSFGEICQGLMVEYHLQNNNAKSVRREYTPEDTIDPKKKSSDNRKKAVDHKKDDSQKYKHFRTLLYICIREAFIAYLKENWQCLREPVLQSANMIPSEEDFCRDFTVGMYGDMAQLLERNPSLASWYVAARFMNPKYLNHLLGSIRNYLQFAGDIEKRAASVYNRTDLGLAEKTTKYKEILSILEFSALFCGNTTNVLDDYFITEDNGLNSIKYAEFLSDFIDFGKRKGVSDVETRMHLFCEQKFKAGENQVYVGTYYNPDGKKMIPNRNVFLAGMYGNPKRLKKSVEKITFAEIQKQANEKIKLDPVLKEGFCVSEDEQKQYRAFQNQKNRIELVDIAIFTELLNDMQSQMVNWVYLRERDLMYFQLGYYYTKLFWTSAIDAENPLNRILTPDIQLKEGAILYQIAAMNSYNLPMIIQSKDGQFEFKKADTAIGVSEDIFCKNFPKGKEIFFEGLEFFENTDEHEEISKLRDYIAHYKYFSKEDKSILELYSEIYDKFFRYDIKLKKSVSFVLQNIMANYFLTLDSQMEEDTKSISKHEHKATRITIGEKKVRSTALTYPIYPDGLLDSGKREAKGKKESILINARSEVFLKQIKALLERR